VRVYNVLPFFVAENKKEDTIKRSRLKQSDDSIRGHCCHRDVEGGVNLSSQNNWPWSLSPTKIIGCDNKEAATVAKTTEPRQEWIVYKKGSRHFPNQTITTTTNVHCPENSCLNEEIRLSHIRCLEGNSTENVDLYIAACVFVRELFSTFEITTTTTTSNSNGAATIGLECVCGNPTHKTTITKRAYQSQFLQLKRPRFLSRQKIQQQQQQRPDSKRRMMTPLVIQPVVSIKLSDFIQFPDQVIQFGTLPDVGIFLRAVLQRRFFSPTLNGFNMKILANVGISGSSSLSPSSSTTSAASSQLHQHHMDRMIGHVCSVILQVCFFVFLFFFLSV
jgi:hypothetical protein